MKAKLFKKLQHILFRASKDTIHQFLQVALTPGQPVKSLATQLLSEKCTANEIHLALIYCRNAMLMMNKQDSDQQPPSSQMILEHYDRLTTLLMRDLEDKANLEWNQLQAELLHKGHAHQLSQACNQWIQNKEINIYNYYQEMPASITVKLLQVKEDNFTIKRSRELITVFAASKTGNTAFTRLPNSELSLALQVADVTKETVHLRYGNFYSLGKEKRRDIRVKNDRPIKMMLKNDAFQQLECHAVDLSISGLGLSFTHETTLQIGDAWIFSIIIQGHHISGKGLIAWVKNSAGHCTAGLTVEYELTSHYRLTSEVHRRRKMIMDELKLKGIPDCWLVN